MLTIQFFHFWSVSGWHNCFDELIFIHLFNYTGVVVVAEADLRCGDFCSKKLSSQIGSFHELLVLATDCFFNFDIFEIHSDGVFGVLMCCGHADNSWEF